MIRVIIERQIADGLAEHYDRAARDTLQKAMQAHGFISGEALHNAFDENHRVVLASYRTVADWQRWAASSERKEIMEALTPMLQTDEKITILEH
ncbi:antibiotic biosynthesis monooxygenase family protein [Marinobacterium jannaschii]|uniref:antibiotic biosynthesis monooxygenase family protein n=1 Tax=Marinobacterium jannaschii TaxID=64970 RepID=UPI0004878697|nr:antibiotic biosynthesis monooxygenase [Marinobacterium jannaschii]